MTWVMHTTLHNEMEYWMDFKNAPPWQTITTPAANLPHGYEKLRMVVDELDVENSPRYRPTPTQTWCNIFVSDVLTAMGLQPGHWVHVNGDPGKQGQGVELNANRLTRWLVKHGPRFGWTETNRLAASDAAERGHTVVLAWDSETSKPGHVAIMLHEGTIAQAGRKNFVGGTVREGFGTLTPRFFVHIPSGPHSTEPR